MNQFNFLAFEADIEKAQTAENHYLKTGDYQALDKAITSWERILKHPDFNKVEENLSLGIINNSAGTYLRRYWATGNINDLDCALFGWESLVKTLDNSPYLPIILNNLGNVLRNRYYHTGDLKDLEHSIATFQKAIKVTPTDSSNLPSIY
jgi:tetratricopeptide (TPR) repeat protein